MRIINNLQSRNQRLINFASEEVKSYRSFHDFPYSLNYVNSLRFYVLNDSDSSDLADGMFSVKQRFHEYFVSDSGKTFKMQSSCFLFNPHWIKKYVVASKSLFQMQIWLQYISQKE